MKRVEVGDVFKDPSGKHRVATMIDDGNYGRILFYDGGCFQESVCTLIRKAPPPPVADCHWVKPGWFIQPDDFNVEGVVADTYGSAWICCTTPNTWIRRNLRHPELQHIKRKAGDAAKVLDQMGDGLNAHKMKWAIHQAAKEYAKKLEQIETECKRIASEGKMLAGQP